MAGHSQFKNIMHRKGRQDAVRVEDVLQAGARNHRRRQDGHARSGDEPAPAAGRAERQGASRCPRTTSSAPSTRRPAAMRENYEEVRYEGYGPGGVAVIVEALTDNRNRSASNVRAAFTKAGGAIGETGSVVVHVGPRRRDRLCGERRRRRQGDGGGDRGRRRRRAVGRGRPHDLSAPSKISARCPRRWRPRSARPNRSRSIWRPQTNVPVDEERAQSLMKLVATLEDDDDVQNVYANFEVDDATLAKLSAA